MTPDKLVERIARVLCKQANRGDPDGMIEHHGDIVLPWWCNFADAAEAVVKDLAAAGLAVVPREPTQDMQISGLVAMVAEIEKDRPPPSASEAQTYMHLGATMRCGRELAAAWRAMVAAAEGEG